MIRDRREGAIPPVNDAMVNMTSPETKIFFCP